MHIETKISFVDGDRNLLDQRVYQYRHPRGIKADVEAANEAMQNLGLDYNIEFSVYGFPVIEGEQCNGISEDYIDLTEKVLNGEDV